MEYNIITNPIHYNFDNEVTDALGVVKEILDDNELRGFYLGNTLKYMLRHKKKNGVEDLKKAKQNLEWLIEVKDNEQKS